MVTNDGDGRSSFFTVVFYYHHHGSLSPSLPPDSNRDIRTDFSTDCAASASPVVFPDNKKVSLPVDLFSHPNQFLRARDRAEPATLTTLPINFDLSHFQKPFGVMEHWSNGEMEREDIKCL
jgi:hypothetical protein